MKGFLSERGVPYVERDIANDETAMRELEELGVMTTPVVRIGDEVVVGFDRARLSTILGLDLPSAQHECCCEG